MARLPHQWIAECGVCRTAWYYEGGIQAYPHGLFCPNCQSKEMTAPGVLWFRTTDDYAGEAEYLSWFNDG
jgi:hypothetical protein